MPRIGPIPAKSCKRNSSRLRPERDRTRARIGVPGNRLTEIVRDRHAVTAGTAIRLAHAFKTTPEFWTNAPTAYDLSKALAEGDFSGVQAAAA